MSRYSKTPVVINEEEQFKDSEIFENRGVRKISHYPTPRLKQFTKEEYQSIKFVTHVWRSGDRFWRLSSKYYGQPKYWWVIARWNFSPTESHLEIGQEIRIPLDLQKVIGLIK